MVNQEAYATEGQVAAFHFTCPGCGAEGDLRIDVTERDPFGCPEKCGSTFILWRDLKGWTITCVVQAMFDESEDDLNELDA